MDRKSITVVVTCAILLVVWQFVIVPKYWPYKPAPQTATNSLETAQSPGQTNTAATPIMTPATSAPRLAMNRNIEEQSLVVTNKDARYTFTSHGGGLKLVELVNYPETIPSWRNRRSEAAGFATLNNHTPSPTLEVLDTSNVQGDGIFTLTPTATGVRAEKALTNGLTLVKEFTLGSNYLLTASVRMENHSTEPVSLSAQEWTIGTATPMSADDKGTMYIGMMWSDGDTAHDTLGGSFFSTRGFACMPRTPPAEFRAGQTNVAWAAVHNQFFALAVMPKELASEVVMRKVDLPRPTGDEAQGIDPNAPPPSGYLSSLIYPAVTIPAEHSLQRQFVLYAGPKEYRTLASIASQLNNNLDAVMGFGRFSGFFAKALLLAMNFLHSTLSVTYGWAIVLITVILRLAFWPLTAASTRSMKKMQALQPQIKAIQEKYKEDPLKAQKKQMELWKENKINPMGGCLPMLIQMPVFIGFFGMIRSAIELRGAHFLWVSDLSKPDTLFMIPGLNFPFNLLPLLMVGVMVWQAHLTPPSPGMDPAQQKMMRYMPALFLVFLYTYSSGMALYMFVSTLLGILQTKLTKTKAPVPAAATPALTPPQKKKK